MNTITMAPTFTLGERLRKARQGKGLDQLELAMILGMARNTLSQYENDRNSPSFAVTVAWARACNVSLDWLAEGIPSNESTPTVAGEGAELYAPRGSNPEPTDYGFTVPETVTELLEHWATSAAS